MFGRFGCSFAFFRKVAIICSGFALFTLLAANIAKIFSIQFHDDYYCSRTGLIDLKGNWLIEPNYNFLCHVRSNDSYWVSDMRIVGPETFSILGHRVYLSINHTWLSLDKDGHVLIPQAVRRWGESQFGTPHIVQQVYHWGVGEMDESGFPLLDAPRSSCRYVGSNRWVVQRDRRGVFAEIEEFVNSFWMIFPNDVADKQELYDSYGHRICELPGNCIDSSEQFSEGLLPISSYGLDKDNNHLEGAVDENGKVVIPMRFGRLGSFSGGMAPALLVGSQLCGFVDKSGNFVIPPIFTGFANFKDGVAFTQDIHSKYGAINLSNKVLIPPVYDDLQWLKDGTISAQVGQRYCIFSKEGQQIKTLSRDNPSSSHPDQDIVYDEKTHHYWIINAKGKIISPPFDGAEHVTEHLIEVTIITSRMYCLGSSVQHGSRVSFGLMDDKGKWILPPTYRDLFFCAPDRFIASKWE